MGSHTLSLPARASTWAARFFSLSSLLVFLVWLFYLSKEKTIPMLAEKGGLSDCVYCNNGWNWHAFLMFLAFGIAMTESILSFSSESLRSTGYAKWVHLAWQTVALILAIVAIVSMIVAKKFIHAPQFYSVHSYCGTLVLAMFSIQYVFGMTVFVLLKHKLSYATRYQLGTYHILLGKFTYFAGIGACVSGLGSMESILIGYGQPFFGSVSMAQNWISILLWFTSAAVFCAMTSVKPTTAEVANAKADGQNSTQTV